jgi:hypothetical protein
MARQHADSRLCERGSSSRDPPVATIAPDEAHIACADGQPYVLHALTNRSNFNRTPRPVYLPLLIGVCCAVLFFRAAQYERMSPWAWTIASIGLTALVSLRDGGVAFLILLQVALFAGMWWYNARRGP